MRGPSGERLWHRECLWHRERLWYRERPHRERSELVRQSKLVSESVSGSERSMEDQSDKLLGQAWVYVAVDVVGECVVVV